MAEPTTIHVSVDRIEGGIAVLLCPDAHRWLLPAELLPEGTGEGDVLAVTLERDPEETGARRERIRQLQRRLRERTEGSGGGAG